MLLLLDANAGITVLQTIRHPRAGDTAPTKALRKPRRFRPSIRPDFVLNREEASQRYDCYTRKGGTLRERTKRSASEDPILRDFPAAGPERYATRHALATWSMKLSLVTVSVAGLGFPEGATTIQIIGSEFDTDQGYDLAPFTKGRGSEIGLELCPPQVGPELRQKFDQAAGDRVHIAMRPICTADGEPRLFVLVRDARGLSLDAVRARPYDHWEPTDKFVFSKGRLPDTPEPTDNMNDGDH